MKTVKITIDFASDLGGQANVNLTGPGVNQNYLITTNDSRTVTLHSAMYTIQIHGTSEGRLNLSVEDRKKKLLNKSCDPVHLFLIGNFFI